MLSLVTDNRRAFELVADAIGAINQYKDSRDRDALQHALAGLREATRDDEHYLLAPYYTAVIEDLLGRSRDAANHLQTLLSQTSTEHLKFVTEMRYNLAVAQYHGYSHENLAAAAATLQKVLDGTRSVLGSKYYRIRLYSRALLAQVYAMWCIPKLPEDVEQQTEQKRISDCYEEAISTVREVLTSPWRVLLWWTDRPWFREASAIANNATGMAKMYYTDFFGKRTVRLSKLRQGLKNFEKSRKLFPRDWANYCDLGSCHMRLGYWANDPHEFEVARQYLTEVVETLRPEYGFALYEIGRSYRIQGRFKDAHEYFSRAMKVPERIREVSDRRVNREKGLADNEQVLYP
jgi:tetratricopeptide (TPR) repeat protein